MYDEPDLRTGALIRTSIPSLRFLSNGSLTTLVTDSGAGFATSRGRALNWWSGDTLEDGDGYLIYLRDLSRGVFWTAGHHPAYRAPQSYRTSWRPGRFRMRRVDDDLEVSTDVCVAPDSGVEIRRIAIRNLSSRARKIEVTTYAEVALIERRAFAAHPAFAKLFVRTERDAATGTLLAERRPRAPAERYPWMFHAMAGASEVEFETDRACFVGRGRDLSAPAALLAADPLSGTTGCVLDPVLCLRSVVALEGGGETDRVLLLGAADDREEALALVRSFYDARVVDAAFAGARAQAAMRLQAQALTEEQAEYYQQLAGQILYGRAGSGSPVSAVEQVAGDPSTLRSLGIDPGKATVVLHAEERLGARVLPDLVRGHRYWQSIALPIDLIIITGDPDPIRRGIASRGGGEARVLRRADLSTPVVELIDAIASLVVTDGLPGFPSLPSPRGEAGAGRHGDEGKRGGRQ